MRRLLLAALLTLTACDAAPRGRASTPGARSTGRPEARSPNAPVASTASLGTWTITGVVEDIGGAVAGALVYADLLSTRSGPKGRFHLDVPGGAGPVAVYARTAHQVGCARAEAPDEPIRITVAPNLTLSGRVVDDRTGDPIRAWVQRAEQSPIRCAPDGRFWIPGIRPDRSRGLLRTRLHIAVVQKGYDKVWRHLQIGPGARLDVRLVRRRNLRARVVDEGGRTRIGARVGLCDEPFGDLARKRDGAWSLWNISWHVTQTDEAGWVRFSASARHRFLAIKAPGFPRHDYFVGPRTPAGHDIVLRRGARLEGRLVRPGGAAVRGRTVYAAIVGQDPFSVPSEASILEGVATETPGLHPIRLGNPLATGVTDEGGRFALDVPKGTYDLYAKGRDGPVRVGQRLWTGAPRRVVLPAPRPPPPRARILFQVRSRDGRKVRGELTVVRAGAPPRRVAWSAYGDGDLELAPGTSALWFSAAGYRPRKIDVRLSGGSRRNLGFVFLHRGGASAHVRVPRREPYGQVGVEVVHVATGVAQRATLGFDTDAVTLTGLPAGRARVRTTFIDDRPGGAEQLDLPDVIVELEEGELTRVSVPLR